MPFGLDFWSCVAGAFAWFAGAQIVTGMRMLGNWLKNKITGSK